MAPVNAREVAHRVFAAEYNASRISLKTGTDERSPTYVVTPLGAKINRVFLVGVLTELDTMGERADLWRARVSDPTGLFTLYAGQYQPEAAKALSELQPPQYVAVVGKARTYEPEPGRVFASVRPEEVQVVDETVRDHWIFEAARHTQARASAMRHALGLEKPQAKDLAQLGVPSHLVEGVLLAREKYAGDVDIDYFERLVREEALRSLVEGNRFGAPEATTRPVVAAVVKPQGPEPEFETKVLTIVESLATSDDKGAQWDVIVAQGRAAGVTEEQVEEALNSLMDKGLIYEPILGRLKTT